MASRCFAPLTNGLSKRIENLVRQLCVAHYNWCGVHDALTLDVWSIGDLGAALAIAPPARRPDCARSAVAVPG
jgi:hypothetical protein